MTRFLIVDAQSVKNTDSAERKSCDAGKKVPGIKRDTLQSIRKTLAPCHRPHNGRGDGSQGALAKRWTGAQ